MSTARSARANPVWHYVDGIEMCTPVEADAKAGCVVIATESAEPAEYRGVKPASHLGFFFGGVRGSSGTYRRLEQL